MIDIEEDVIKQTWKNNDFYPTKKEFEKLYLKEGLSKREIARKFNMGSTTILYWLKKFDISRRPFSDALKEKPKTEEHKRKISETRKRLFKEGKLTSWNKKLRGREYLKHFKSGKIWNKELTGYSTSWKGKKHSEKTKRKLSRIAKKREMLRWQDPNYKKKQLKLMSKGLHKLPTKPEKKVIEIIKENKFPLIYTANGKIMIEGFVPDFMDNNGSKKIIEVFGDYWHKLPNVIKRDEKKLNIYTKYGFQILILWEHELKTLSKNIIAHKIKDFLEV